MSGRRMYGYAVKVRKILSKENYDRLRNLEDDDLRLKICQKILEFCDEKKAEGWDNERIKEEVNKILEHFWRFYDLVERAIELEQRKIEKLENIRKGIFPYMLRAGSEKLDEISLRLR